MGSVMQGMVLQGAGLRRVGCGAWGRPVLVASGSMVGLRDVRCKRRVAAQCGVGGSTCDGVLVVGSRVGEGWAAMCWL